MLLPANPPPPSGQHLKSSLPPPPESPFVTGATGFWHEFPFSLKHSSTVLFSPLHLLPFAFSPGPENSSVGFPVAPWLLCFPVFLWNYVFYWRFEARDRTSPTISPPNCLSPLFPLLDPADLGVNVSLPSSAPLLKHFLQFFWGKVGRVFDLGPSLLKNETSNSFFF